MVRHYVAEDYLSTLAFAYNRGVSKSTRTAPFDLVLSRPPAALGAESVRDFRAIGYSLSKATFLRACEMPSLSTGKRLEKAHERYFDKTIASVNRNLKAGDQAFLDVCSTPSGESEDAQDGTLSGGLSPTEKR